MSRFPGIDLQDKLAWCEEGERREREFVGNHNITGWGIGLNPGKQKDVCAYDLLGIVPMDLKSIDTQWRDSQAMFGIPPEYAISINLGALQRYRKKYPNIILVLDVAWAGTYTLTIPRAQALQKAGKAKPHQYEKRKNDTKGNAKVSLIFDLRDLDEVVRGNS